MVSEGFASASGGCCSGHVAELGEGLLAVRHPPGGMFDTLGRVCGLIRWFKAVVSLDRDFDNRAIPRKDPAEIDS